jgi:periplasmic copper chaperone A
MKKTIKFIATQSINITTIAIFAMVFISFQAVAKNNIADVVIKDVWIRTSVPGQKATGAFMAITAKANLKLVGVSSPVAGVAEVHEMKMEGDIMRMRAVAGGLDLPAGKAVELKPGGYHVMLMDLKAALPKDSVIALTLVFKDAKGEESMLELKVPVATTPPSGKPAMDMSQHKH